MKIFNDDGDTCEDEPGHRDGCGGVAEARFAVALQLPVLLQALPIPSSPRIVIRRTLSCNISVFSLDLSAPVLVWLASFLVMALLVLRPAHTVVALQGRGLPDEYTRQACQ